MADRIRELAGHRLAVGNPTGSLPTKRTATWAVLNEVLQRRRSNAAPDDVECRPWHLKIAEHDTAAPGGGGERDGVDQRHVRTHDMWQTLRIITGPAGAVTNRQPRPGGAKISRSGDGASRCRASSSCSTSVEAGRLPASATGLTSLLGIVQVANASLRNWDHWFYDSSSMNIVNGEECIAPLHTIIFPMTDSVSGDQRSAMPDEGHQSDGARSRHGLLAAKNPRIR